MKIFAIASAFLSVFAAIASAQEGVTWTKPNSKPEEGNSILTPGLYQKVPVGKPFAVTWTPTTPGTISIVLYKGPGSNIIAQYAIASKIANSGSFLWTPETTFPDTKEGYGLRIIVDGTGQHQWSTQFGFLNENPGNTNLISTNTGTGTGTGTTTTGAQTTTTASVSATGNTTSLKLSTTTTLASNRTTSTTKSATTLTTTKATITLSTSATETTEEATETSDVAEETSTTASGNAAVATAVSYGMGVIAFAAAGMALL
jgi:hypothetical protein